MSDWYDKASLEVRKELAEEASLTSEQAREAYSFLSEIGLIDYDIEKEILYERYIEETED